MRSGFAVKRTAAAPFSVKSVQLGAVSSMLKTIRLERITKRFPGVLACDDVSLTIRPGIVHAIVGENGAGKSTLMGILAGLHQPDAGSIYINDARVRFTSPRDAVAKGIGMVYQEFMLVRSLTAVDNIILGFEPTRFSYISRDEALRRIQELMELHGISVPSTNPWVVCRCPNSNRWRSSKRCIGGRIC